MTINRTARHSPAARQARRRSGLRTNSIAIFMIAPGPVRARHERYGLGMGVNLYARVPAADHGAGAATALGRALTSQPAVLTGVALLCYLATLLVAGPPAIVPGGPGE